MIFLKLTTAVRQKAEDMRDGDITGIAKLIIKQMISFLGGVLLSSVNDFGAFSPFGVAYVAAVGQDCLISSGLGAAAGYILTQDSVSSLRYIAALVCTAVFTRLFADSEKIGKFKLLPSCISFLTCFLTSLVVILARGAGGRSFLLYLGEAALAFAVSYFLSTARGAINAFGKQGGLSVRDLSAVLISVYLFLLSIAGITIFGISFARIAAIIIILFFAYIFKEAGGAIAGISAALIFSVSEGVGATGTAYAFAGLLCGVFSYMNRYVSAAVFLAAFDVSFVFGGGSTEKIYLLAEVTAACVIFMSVPEKYIRKAENSIIIKKEPQTTQSQRQVILNRLKSASAAVGEMSQTVSVAAGVLKQTEMTDTVCIFSKVQDSVCDGCRLFDFCWNKNFRDCKKSFDEMNEILKNNGTVTNKNIPQYIKGCCVKNTELAECFNKTYINYVAASSAQNKIEKIRQITGEQFGGICSMLAELSEEFAEGITFDNPRADRIEEMLLNTFSLKPESVICITDADGKIKLEIKFAQKPEKLRQNELKEELETVCATELDMPVIISGDNGVTVCFCEKTRYRVAAAATRITADDEELCGDSYESFYDGKGNYVVVLSDGMGTGIRAAVDSSLASGMMAKLLRAGFSYGSSLRLVNSALLLKSKEESLATLDIMSIDLYSGEARFYKAGAAISLIKRKEKICEIKRSSLPVGILKETDFAEASGELHTGDIVIVASDGAFELSGNAAETALAVTLDEKVEEISQRIAEKARDAKNGRRCDDITVIAVKLLDNN